MSSTHSQPSSQPHASGPSVAPDTTSRVRVRSLGSGSSGNAFLIQRGDRTLMLDCGVGIRTITRELASLGSNIASLDGILITHEHIDHIRTLPRMTGHDIPIIATSGTAGMADVPDDQRLEIVADKPVDVAGFTIWALGVSHDAAQPCGYLIEMAETRITILTDLGTWQEHLAEPIAASDLIVLEANHDEEMLRRGPYPAHLKRRVASDRGHLSNRASGEALAELARVSHSDPTVWLAHLSATNNKQKIAEETVRAALMMVDLDLPVIALPRTEAGPIWTPRVGSRTNSPFARTEKVAPMAQLSLLDGFE